MPARTTPRTARFGVAPALVRARSPLVSTPVGRAILPAAAFQAALWRGLLIFAPGHRRLRPGASQDRLPPSSITGILARFSRQVSSLGARRSRKLVRNAG